MEVVRRTEVRGQKSSDGQKSVDESRPTDGSPEVTTPQLTRELCGNGDGNVEL